MSGFPARISLLSVSHLIRRKKNRTWISLVERENGGSSPSPICADDSVFLKREYFLPIVYIQRGMRLDNFHPFHFVNCPPYTPMELLALFFVLLGLTVPGSESAVHRDVVPVNVLCPF